MKKLYFGQVPLDFSPDKDAAFSVNCFLGREEVYPDWEDLPFAPVLHDVSLFKKAEAKVRSLAYDYLLPKISAELNQKHNKDYDINFWSFVLNPWLFFSLNTYWMLYFQLVNFLSKVNSETYSVELPLCETWGFPTTSDYINSGILNIEFQQWIISDFLKRIAPEKWEIRYIRLDKPAYAGESKPNKYNRSLPERIRQTLKEVLWRQRCTDSYGFSISKRLFFSMFLSLKPVKPWHGEADRRKENYQSPDQLLSFFGQSFLDSLETLLKASMPLCFTENFEEYDSRARKATYRPGKIRLLSGGSLFNDQLNFFLAHAERHGEKIIFTQHGGGFANAKVFPLSIETEYRHYAFFSWGWSRHDDYQGNFVPLSSPYLSTFKNKHRQENDSLIFVGGYISPLLLRIHTRPAGEQLIYYRREKIKFLANLNDKIQKQVLYRPHISSASLEDEVYINKKYRKIPICEGELHPQILKCRLLVLDHPLTTLNIAMPANIPLVCFWNKDDWVMCKEAAPYFQALEDAGVIFPNGKAAAQKVNEIWEDIPGWWQQPDVQKARREWNHQFARAHKQWWWEWLTTLWKM
jgi:putative transferase (TIGR04331 family)